MSSTNKDKKDMPKGGPQTKNLKMWKKYYSIAFVALVLIAALIILIPKLLGSGKNADSDNTQSTVNSNSSNADSISSKQELEDALGNKKVAVLFFHSTTCQPCLTMEAYIEEIKPKFKDRVVFISVIVNDPEEKSLVEEYEIQLIPTTFIFDKEGNTEKTVGVIEKDKFISTLDKLVNE